MKIASFNVNSLRARLPIVLQWLAEHQPNVLCVQETKVQDVDFPTDAFETSGYKHVFKGQKSYNGVAIFSKNQISNVKFGFSAGRLTADDEPTRLGEGAALATETIETHASAKTFGEAGPSRSRKDQARLIKAEINGIVIVNTYIPQGYLPESEKFEYKLNWFNRLLTFFDKNFKPTDPVLWVGDFNVAPEPIDVYDPEGLLGHVCFHPEVHKAMKMVCHWGFVDVFRMHCDQPGQYTFWDYRLRNSFKKNLGWRLDHIMATQPLAKKAVACYIDKNMRLAEKPSDHTPIVAEFDW